MTAYYNEHDLYAAQWLRNLIAAGHIAPGDVDTRSIEDVKPDDLRPYTQCHFFAGIGVWSLALRRSGWPDDRAIWTGSCPCQPFSAAGQGAAFADERHLWPAFFHLITQRRPAVVVGEQVASKDANAWIDLVQTDMEALGHPFGAVAFPSAGVGAPHIRDRTYWVADAYGNTGGEGRAHIRGWAHRGDAQPRTGLGGGGVLDGMAYSSSTRLEGRNAGALGVKRATAERSGKVDGLADDDSARFFGEQGLRLQGANFHDADGRGPVNGLWAGADWIPCRDNKWRPVEPSTFPLAHGAASRMGRLRAYGNAINVEAARVFIDAFVNSAYNINS